MNERIPPKTKDAAEMFRSLISFMAKADIYTREVVDQVIFELRCERDTVRKQAPRPGSDRDLQITFLDAAIAYLVKLEEINDA